jgi:L-asparaginase
LDDRKYKIAIIYTGGTIGGEGEIILDKKLDERGFIQLLGDKNLLPEDTEIIFSSPLNKFSECMLPADWVLIAESVSEIIARVDGVIVLHGTDTLTYTAAALAFMFGGVEVPIMVTGANIPLSRPGSDAADNIKDCFSAIKSGEFAGAGVCVCFGGYVHSAVRLRKVSVEGNSFRSFNDESLGEICRGCTITTNVLYMHKQREYYAMEKKIGPFAIHPEVSLYKIYPGFKASAISNDENDAIILELYNNGTGPTGLGKAYSLEENIREYGKPVFAVSQHNCPVSMNTYPGSVELKKAGVVGLNMLAETALVKLMWLMGCGFEGENLEMKMLEDIRGEMIYGDKNNSENL